MLNVLQMQRRTFYARVHVQKCCVHLIIDSNTWNETSQVPAALQGPPVFFLSSWSLSFFPHYLPLPDFFSIGEQLGMRDWDFRRKAVQRFTQPSNGILDVAAMNEHEEERRESKESCGAVMHSD